ncbi:MAG: branched-chain amino acid ABC transporter permease [Ktedonobacterales bacterium]
MQTSRQSEVAPLTAEGPPVKQMVGRAGLLAVAYRYRGLALALVGGILLAVLPSLYDVLFGFSAGFELHRISLIGIFVLAAFAQNILTGYAAQPSLGNAAFFGLGGYLLAWLAGDLSLPYWSAVLVAMIASAVVGVVVGGPALRVSGAYLAIATLGLVFIAGSLFDLWDTAAGRQSYEINNMPAALADDHVLYFLVMVIAVAVFAVGAVLLRSRVGRAWIAIRDSEAAAVACGVQVTYYKLLAFVVSAAVTGLAGALYAIWAQTAGAQMSRVDQTIVFLAMIVVGGLGSILGSVLGALFVGFLPLALGQLPSPLAVGGLTIQVSTLTTGIYGLLLLLALIFFPAGLASVVERSRSLAGRIARRGGGA